MKKLKIQIYYLELKNLILKYFRTKRNVFEMIDKLEMFYVKLSSN